MSVTSQRNQLVHYALSGRQLSVISNDACEDALALRDESRRCSGPFSQEALHPLPGLALANKIDRSSLAH